MNPSANPQTVTLDVREDIRNGWEPFSKIMTAVRALRDDEQLLLIAPFEPVPLFQVLAARGFRHTAQVDGSGDWQVLFTRVGGSANPDLKSERRNGGDVPTTSSAGVVDVDARGLEPPQPMIRILEALAALPDYAMVRARTDRRPMHLYAQLEARGFLGETEEQSDGSFLTQIRRR